MRRARRQSRLSVPSLCASSRLAALAVGLWLALAIGPLAPVAAQDGGEIVEHPSALTYGPLDFEVPDADGYRRELASDVPAFLVEDRSLPLVDLTVLMRIGSWLEPLEQTGLAELAGALMRTGGAGELDAKAFDDAVDAIAGDFSSEIGVARARMSMNCLSTVLDECLDLFFSMLASPRFDADRLKLTKQSALEGMKKRNDDAADVMEREAGWLLLGPDHVESRLMTSASLAAIGQRDLAEFHRRWVHPGHMVIAAAGDFDADDLAAKLSALLGRFGDEGRVQAPWPPEAPAHQPAAGVYVAEHDIPQGRVEIGHRTFRRQAWGSPDHFALEMMDAVLGNGGFTTRLMKRIRSDEGLAYGAYSSFEIGDHWPGRLGISFESKSETVALASMIALEEFDRIRSEPVGADELQTARAAAIETFPTIFASARDMARVFAEDEFLGRPHDYWRSWRQRVEAVTPADVQRVAERHLLPENLVMLVVGDWEAIEPGDSEGRASMADVVERIGGEVTMLPVRDPLTFEAPEP